jgi:two-component system, LuxR family, sensor kinase FixL
MSVTRRRLLSLAVFVAAMAGFILDLYVELGIAVPVVYVAVIWLAWSTRSSGVVFVAASTCVALTIVGVLVSPAGVEWLKIFLNRSLAISAIVITALLAARHLLLLEKETLRAAEIENEKLQIQQERDRLAQQNEQQRDRARVMASITEDLRAQREKLAREVAQRISAEETLTEREQHIRTLLDSTAEGIYGIDVEGKCTFANQACASLLGYDSTDELLGQQMHELIHHTRSDGNPYPNSECLIYQAVRDGEGVHVDDEVLWRRDGTSFAAEYWAFPISNNDSLSGCVVTFLDVTDRVAAREQFRRVVEAAPSGMVMIDSTGAIRLVNTQTEALFHYSRETLIGKPVELLIPERFHDGHPQLRDSFFQSPTVRTMGQGRELFGRRRDGSEFPVEIGLNPVEVGGERFVLSSVVDITERRTHELALRQSEERVRSIVDAALDAVVTMGQDGLVTGWNPRAEVIFGWSSEEAIGRSVAELIVPPSQRNAHTEGLNRFLQTGLGSILNQRLELTAIRKDQTRFPIELTISALNSGEKFEFSAFVNDITTRKTAAAEIQRINEELRQKNEEMQQFVYTVSHDLKSPLVTLEGFVGFLREELDDDNPEEAAKCMERIVRSTARMGQLINDLLQLSRVGMVRNEPEPIDLNVLVAELAADLENQIEQSGFTLNIQPALPTILADRVRVTQVFENLITNAMKYGRGADRPEITIGTEKHEGTSMVFVQDNGPGIAPEHQERIFRPFERLQTDQEGTGIGLAIVHRIVQINGGSVSINSVPGEGARFNLSLPVVVDGPKDE